MIITIDGTQIKAPTGLKKGIFRISKSGRVASGKMVHGYYCTKAPH